MLASSCGWLETIIVRDWFPNTNQSSYSFVSEPEKFSKDLVFVTSSSSGWSTFQNLYWQTYALINSPTGSFQICPVGNTVVVGAVTTSLFSLSSLLGTQRDNYIASLFNFSSTSSTEKTLSPTQYRFGFRSAPTSAVLTSNRLFRK